MSKKGSIQAWPADQKILSIGNSHERTNSNEMSQGISMKRPREELLSKDNIYPHQLRGLSSN